MAGVLPAIVIGIDPGKGGALAAFVIQGDRYKLSVCLDFDEKTIVEYFKSVIYLQPEVFIENVHAAPGQGVTSMFSFGKNFGWWLGLLDSLLTEKSTHLVAPQSWSPIMLGHNPNYKKQNNKLVALDEARKLFGNTYFSRKKDNGRADASLIACYGIRYIIKGLV